MKSEYLWKKVYPMNRKKKLVKNIVIIFILFFVLINRSGLYLSPVSAHEASERSIHYGPSQLIHVTNYEGDKYMLCKYEEWVSCDRIERVLFFLWKFGSSPFGFENDLNEKLKFSWSYMNNKCQLYGIVNDDSIKMVEIVLEDGRTFTQTEFHDGLFLFNWTVDGGGIELDKITGYDGEANKAYIDWYYK